MLNTLADQGGLTDVELARWMGRRDPSQNEAYKHGTVAQRVAWAQEMIKSGMLRGPVAETYHAMHDPIEKERFLETFVNIAHFTPFGVCTDDFALEPCKYHLNCLSGCADYLRTKGDQEERRHLTEIRNFHLVQLENYKNAVREETSGASNWVSHAERIVAGANMALAVDDPDTAENGGKIAVFPNISEGVVEMTTICKFTRLVKIDIGTFAMARPGRGSRRSVLTFQSYEFTAILGSSACCVNSVNLYKESNR
jgi:hypothetical protein